MKVSQLMTRDVLTVRPADPLSRAAQIMWEADCGCVPVVGPSGEVEGMITDRDACMAAYTRGRALATLSVAQAMSREPVTCRANDALESALRTMAAKQLHRLPVIDDERRLAGVLSMADVLQGADAKDATARRKLADGVVDALKAVTQPRRRSEDAAKGGGKASASARA